MQKNKIIKISIGFIIAFAIFFCTPVESSHAENLPITKDLSITLNSVAERLSDLEFWEFNPKGEQIDYKLVTNGSDQKTEQMFNLGSQSDERLGCTQVVNTRKMGICEDGLYTFNIRSTDAAGNTSDQNAYEIERDTVSPEKAIIVVIPDDSNHKISLKISGEIGSKITINGASYNLIPSNGSAVYLVISSNNWEYGTKYVWKIFLTDRAGNVSQPSYTDYTTPLPEVKSATECKATEGGKIAYPFEGYYSISSYFGLRDLDGDGIKENWHSGQDFRLPSGTNVLSSEKGIVVGRSDVLEDGYGILVHHPEIGITTVYWHFSKNYVKVGHNVEKGMIIGLSGNTGFSTGPHLHFGVKIAGISVDPQPWLGNCIDENNSNTSEDESTNKIEDFIKNNMDYSTQIEAHDSRGTKLYADVKDDLKSQLDVHQWCGIEIQDFQYIKLKNGDTAYDGAAMINPSDGKVYLVKNGLWDRYVKESGPCGELGSPRGTAGWSNGTYYSAHYTETEALQSPYGTKGWYQNFDKGAIYFNGKNTIWNAFAVAGKIGIKYHNAGGSWGNYGFPTGHRFFDNSANSICQWFEGGNKICETETIESIFDQKEGEVFSEFKPADGNNGTIHNYCGMLIKDYSYYKLKENGQSYYYGWIMYKEGSEPYFVLDYIGWTYWNNGGCNYFGYPTMDTTRTGGHDGWYHSFSNGPKVTDIHWHDSNSKAQGKWVTGGLRDRFRELGGSQSYLGYPTNNEKSAKSLCGKDGWHQEFEHGKEYFSSVGVADWEYKQGILNMKAGTIEYYWSLGEMNGELGWPKSGSYRNSSNAIYLENGKIYRSGILNDQINYELSGGCHDLNQRKNDPDNNAAKLIHSKEDSYNSYQRIDNGSGNGTIHQWTCEANTMWVVDYDKIGDYGNSIVIANESLGKAFLMTGDIWTKYRDNNGCTILKKPTSDQFDTGVNKMWLLKPGVSIKQIFEGGDIYSYDNFNLFGTATRHTYMIYGAIKSKYDSNNGIKGNYKFLTSDRYSYTENDFTTFCQNSEGGKICENDIPQQTDEQKKLGELLGRFVSTSEIKDECELRVVSIDGGIAYYDGGKTGKVTGAIYDKWFPECKTYGKPEGSTQDVSNQDKNGQFQRFQLDNWSKVSDFYNSEYSVVVLEGWERDMFNQIGFTQAGFPKGGIYGAKASCTKDTITNGIFRDTQRGRIYRYEKSGTWTYYVKGSGESSIAKYFWDNGDHNKFGLPTSNEKKSSYLGMTLSVSQDFELTTIKDPLIGSVGTDPKDFHCPGVEPTPTPTNASEQPQCNENEVWDGDKCTGKQGKECPDGFHDNGEDRCVKDFLNSVHPIAQDANCVNIDVLYTGDNGDDDFGWREKYKKVHEGIDIRALNNNASCKVNSVSKGLVVVSEADYTGANMVDVQHDKNYTTRYLHGWDLIAKIDKEVNVNDYIFTMGCTGSYCGGRHLHFALFKDGVLVDPQLENYFGYMGQSFYYERIKTSFDGTFYNTTKIY